MTAWGVGQAHAQDENLEPGETSATEVEGLTEEESSRLEVITVSAERRDQDLQKVPESVSSFSGTNILDQGLINFNTLQYNVPSLFSGGGLTKITLRGVGSEIVGPGIDPGFAVHINNVFSARETTGLIDYFDIERVDVLRGPQGTLWGRNSTGGAINIITNRPVYDFDANADLEYGWFDGGATGMRIRSMLNIPIVDDKLALRVALLTHFNDGYMLMRSTANHQRVDDTGASTLRASLRWQADEDVTVDFIGSWLGSRDAGPGRKFDGDYYTPVAPVPFPSWQGAGPGHNYDGALPNPDDPYEGTNDEPQREIATVWTATILVDWQAEQFAFDSITGYQSTDYFLHRDQDASSLPISTLDLTDKSRQLSQEFLVNSTWDRPYNYTLGTIYQYDWTPRTELWIPNAQNTADSANWALFPTFAGLSLVDGCPPNCPPLKLPGELRNDYISALTEAKNHVFGLYGNLSWEVIDDLTLSAGGRFSYTYRDWNDQSYSQTYSGAFSTIGLQILQIGVPQTHDWTAGTWKVSADYQLMDEYLFWASVGTGSRAGGFNFSEEQPFKAEFILAVETGIKSMFFDDRLMLNLTGFWYDWKDPQIAGVQNALPYTTNAPSATSYGVEFEWRALPIDDLALNGSFGWLEAFYDEDYYSGDQTLPDFTQSPDSRVTQINLNGNTLPRSPQFTVSVGAEYTFDTGRWGTLTPRVDFYYRDEINFRQYGNPADVTPSYTRTDARIIWRSDGGRFWGEVYARNLENNAVETNQEINASIYRVHYLAPPINGGLRVGYNYE